MEPSFGVDLPDSLALDLGGLEVGGVEGPDEVGLYPPFSMINFALGFPGMITSPLLSTIESHKL